MSIYRPPKEMLSAITGGKKTLFVAMLITALTGCKGASNEAADITSSSSTYKAAAFVSKPMDPVDITATASAGVVSLDWRLFVRGIGPNRYDIYRSVSGTNQFSKIGSTIHDTSVYAPIEQRIYATQFQDYSFLAGTSLDYYITMTETNGTVSQSKTKTIRPIGTFSMDVIRQDQTNNLHFSWSNATGADSYNVLTGGSRTALTTLLTNATSPASSGSFTIGSPSYFRVQALNSLNGNSLSNNTLYGAPMGAFTAALDTSTFGHIYMTWTASASAMGYKIYYGTTPGSYPNLIADSAVSPHELNLSALLSDTNYYFKVIAGNGNIIREATNDVLINFSRPTAPVLSATYSNAGTALSWTPSTSGAGTIRYRVFRSTTSGSNYSMIASDILPTTYLDSFAPTGMPIYYVVVGDNGFMTSVNSNEVSVKAIAHFSVTASITAPSAIRISWPNAAGAESFTLKYGTVSGTYPNVVSTSATSPYDVTGLTPGTTYYFMVTASNTVGITASHNASLPATSIPLGAFTLSATNVFYNSFDATWTASGGATFYRLKYGTASGNYSTTVSSNATSPTTVSGLTLLSTYYVQLTASNAYGSLISPELVVNTTDVPPASISIAGSPFNFTLGKTITPIVPTISGGGPVALCVSDPPLPAGLTLHPTNCTISGRPTVSAHNTVYKISATNSGGAASANITFPVNEVTANFSQYSNIFTLGTGTTSQTLTINLSQAIETDTTINYATVPQMNTAVAGTDYTALSGSVFIPAGGTSATISLSLAPYSGTNLSKMLHLVLTTTDNGVSIGSQNASRSMLYNPNVGVITAIASTGGGGSASNDHFCAISTGGVLRCWGFNSTGQIGDGSTANRPSPVIINSGTAYASVSVGSQHSCGITTTGVLKCWGYNAYGQLGDNTTSTRYVPTIIDSGTTYSMVSTGHFHTCGLTTAGVVKCWGYNAFGQVGDNTLLQKNGPTVVDTGVAYSKISAGDNHSCAVTTTGSILKCWGQNSYGQIGDNSGVNRQLPVIIDSGVTYSEVAGGIYTTCAITTAGVLKCWGLGSYYTIGDGVATNRPLPVVVDAGTTYSKVSPGFFVACGVTTAGVLKCWGRNEYATTGDGTMVTRATPFAIDAGTTYTDVTSKTNRTCALTSGGALKCWGITNWGNLGFGANPTAITPAAIPNTPALTNFKLADMGYFGMAISAAGQLLTWGGTWLAPELGLRGAPTLVNPAVTFTQVAPSTSHACALTSGGVIRCWGSNAYGGLGNGVNGAAQATQVVADPGTLYSKVVTGYYNTCGITTSGVLKCWGYNGYGTMGTGGTSTQVLTPTVVNAGTTYSDVSLHQTHICGVTTAGVLKCWGNNDQGQIGNNTLTNIYSPQVIDSGVTYSKVFTSTQSTCGITTSGNVKCWGNNSNGQLGDNTATQRRVPTSIADGATYAHIISGYLHRCGVTTTGVLKCWGRGTNGQVGDGTMSSRWYPVVIDSGTTYSPVGYAGAYHSCALTTAGVLKCWGANYTGASGDNLLTSMPTLVY